MSNPTSVRESSNPLLRASSLPFGAIPFDQIRFEHFAPAFEAGLIEAKANLESLQKSWEAPTFSNTIEAIEFLSESLDRVQSVFSNLLGVQSEERLQNLAQEFLPKLASLSNDLFLDDRIFDRVKKVHEVQASLELTDEQIRLLDKTYRAFLRNGALLGESEKAEIREIDGRLATLGQTFSDRVLKETNSFEFVVENSSRLQGVPEAVRQVAQGQAQTKGKPEGSALLTLHQPCYVPVMQFCEDREIRETLWRAYTRRCNGGDQDNWSHLIEIARLRAKRAQLLGFDTHADFVLDERMAKTPQKVREFLDGLLSVSRKAAERELTEVESELRSWAKEKGIQGTVELAPWDVAFLSERIKKKRFQLDEEKLRPYFPLKAVLEGVMDVAHRLYGLKLQKRTDLPVYHSDVEVYEVVDSAQSKWIGLLYVDLLNRPEKRPGAWMTHYREQGLDGAAGEVLRPLVGIVGNFMRPTDESPSLLSMDDVRTLFHEFGHALHGLLSECTYRSLAGTNVYWDFVELPSQVLENWARQKEVLRSFAKHYRTGEPLPDAWVDQILAASRFMAGWFSLRQLSFGYLDMAWHTWDGQSFGMTPLEFERTAIEKTALLPPQDGASVSTAFSHIFAGGYSAGYYSYKWAEVLDADAFEYFQEKGIFSQEVAKKFRSEILERGGSEHPMELYLRFRGREPDAQALLRRDGLVS